MQIAYFDVLMSQQFSNLLNGRTVGSVQVTKGLPDGMFLDKRFLVVPRYQSKTPFLLTLDNLNPIDISILFLGAGASEIKTMSSNGTQVSRFYPTLTTPVVFLDLQEGYSLIKITDTISRNTISRIVSCKNYATFLYAYAAETTNSFQTVDRTRSEIFGEIPYKIATPLLKPEIHAALPTAKMFEIFGNKTLVLSYVWDAGSTKAVVGVAKALSGSTPLITKIPRYKTVPGLYPVISEQQRFSGYLVDVWSPSKYDLSRTAFVQYIQNTGKQIIELDQHKIVFMEGLEKHVHWFDNTSQDSLSRFGVPSNNLFLDVNIDTNVGVHLQAPSYSFDTRVEVVLGNVRVHLDMGIPFDTGVPFDGDPIDPLFDGWIGKNLTGHMDGHKMDTQVTPYKIWSDANANQFLEYTNGYFVTPLEMLGETYTATETVVGDGLVTIGLSGSLQSIYAETTATFTSTSATPSTVVTAAKVLATGNYVGIALWDIGNALSGNRAETKTIVDGVTIGHALTSGTDRKPGASFFWITGNGIASHSASITLAAQTGTNSSTTQSKILMLKVGANTQHTQSAAWETDTALATQTWTSALSLAFTPVLNQNYLVLANIEVGTNNEPATPIGVRLLNGATPVCSEQIVVATGDRLCVPLMAVQNLVGATTLELQLSCGSLTQTVALRNANLIAIPFAELAGVQSAASATLATHVGVGLQNGISVTWTPASSVPTFWLGFGAIATTADSNVLELFDTQGGYEATPARTSTSIFVPGMVARQNGCGTTARTDTLRFGFDGTASTSTQSLRDQTLVAWVIS